MAKTTKIVRVVGNRGRVFGSPSRQKKRSKRPKHRSRANTGEILAYTLAAGNPGRKAKRRNMAKRKRKLKFGSAAWRARYMHKKRSNTGTQRHRRRRNTSMRMTRRRNTGMRHYRRRNTGRRNPGTGSVGEVITTSTFVLVGALGSKLGAQLVLGSNNTGVVGYAANLAIGGVLWFLTDKIMKNKTAASGVIAGTVAQLILRLINDYTPFGSYLSGLGFGDYQMQSYVTPQILTDPTRNANIRIPSGWGQGMAIAAAGAPAGGPAVPANAPGTTGGGRTMRGMGSSIYDGGGLY
jgi:hypothetical protein